MSDGFDSEDDDVFRNISMPADNDGLTDKKSVHTEIDQDELVTTVPETPPSHSQQSLLTHQTIHSAQPVEDDLVTTVPETPPSSSPQQSENLENQAKHDVSLTKRKRDADGNPELSGEAVKRRGSRFDKFLIKDGDENPGPRRILSVKQLQRRDAAQNEEPVDIPISARDALKGYLLFDQTDYPLVTAAWVNEKAKKISSGETLPMMLLSFREGLKFDARGKKKPLVNSAKLYDETGSIVCAFDNTFLSAYADLTAEGTTIVVANSRIMKIHTGICLAITLKNITHLSVDTSELKGEKLDKSKVKFINEIEILGVVAFNFAKLDTEDAKKKLSELRQSLARRPSKAQAKKVY